MLYCEAEEIADKIVRQGAQITMPILPDEGNIPVTFYCRKKLRRMIAEAIIQAILEDR